MNIISHFSGISSQEGNLGHIIFTCFKKAVKPFSRGDMPFYIPTCNVQMTQFLHIHTSTYFSSSNSDRCVVITHCVLICTCLMTNDVKHIFNVGCPHLHFETLKTTCWWIFWSVMYTRKLQITFPISGE